jgi:ribosome-binding protein aMBF1 (putative translation factor)
MQTIEKNGTVFVLVPQEAWQKIASGDLPMPELPPADVNGDRPALEAVRVMIARGIIRDRMAIGWSQAELARRSGVRVETLNRIERAKVTPDEATIKKIDKALSPKKSGPPVKASARRAVKFAKLPHGRG